MYLKRGGGGGHEIFSLVKVAASAIFSYPYGVGAGGSSYIIT